MRRAMKPAATRFTPSAEFRRKVQGQIGQRRGVGLRWLWPVAVTALATDGAGGGVELDRARCATRHFARWQTCTCRIWPVPILTMWCRRTGIR